MTTPEVRYAASGPVRIAYQVIGNGSVDLVFVSTFVSNLDVNWEDPGYSRLLRRLSAFARVIVVDKRGTGLSDRVDIDRLPSLGERIGDLRAVMDAAGCGRAVFLGAGEGAALSILFAATWPARTRALVLFGAYAHFATSVMTRPALDKFVREIEKGWGSGVTLPWFAPERAGDGRVRAWWARLERQSASPTAAVALMRMNAQVDVRGVLDAVRVPTLLMHRRGDVWADLAGARRLAQRIRGARLIELSGRDHAISTGEIDRIVDEVEEFVTGMRPMPSRQRVLATMMIAHLIAPDRLARKLGDGRWRERLDQFRQAAAEIAAPFGGVPVVAGAGDVFMRFEAPARAILCAIGLRDAADALELKLAAGIHTGEVEIQEDTLSGTAVHVTERISIHAAAGEVLVSGVVTELVSGSGLHFVERPAGAGEDGLHLFSVVVQQHLEPMARIAKTPSLEALSHREREVLALVADGLSNAAIAAQLRLSDHTVKRHVANILLKLDLPTRTAAAALAARAVAG